MGQRFSCADITPHVSVGSRGPLLYQIVLLLIHHRNKLVWTPPLLIQLCVQPCPTPRRYTAPPHQISSMMVSLPQICFLKRQYSEDMLSWKQWTEKGWTITTEMDQIRVHDAPPPPPRGEDHNWSASVSSNEWGRRWADATATMCDLRTAAMGKPLRRLPARVRWC